MVLPVLLKKGSYEMKKITSLVLLTLLLIAVSVMSIQAVSIYTDGDYSFADIDANNVALYAYNGDSDVLVIPEQFSGRAVSEVYDYAFENNTDLTVIDFSQNSGWLKNIGIKSFAECTGLTGDLNLPSSIRNLNIGSFQGCTGFTSLVINTGVRDIPRQCFNRCSGLREVYLPSDLETIGDIAFGNCDNLEKVYVPRSVTSISETAFSNSYPTLYVYYNSYAHNYAVSNSIPYVLLDGVKLGDVNVDGYININDVTALQSHLAEYNTLTGIGVHVADVDGSGEVKIDDATILQEFLAEYQVAYSIGEVVTQ